MYVNKFHTISKETKKKKFASLAYDRAYDRGR